MSGKQDFDKRVGKNLARLRGGMSQKELADRMRERGHKWSQATVWSTEQGERALKYSEVDDLLTVLGDDRPGFHWSPLLTGEKGAWLRNSLRELEKLHSELKDLMWRYNEALTEVVMAADEASKDPDEVPNYLWHATVSWLENGPLVRLAIREDRRYRLPDIEETQEEMIDLELETFQELLDHHRKIAQEQGYESWEEMQKNNYDRHNVWSTAKRLSDERPKDYFKDLNDEVADAQERWRDRHGVDSEEA